MSMGDEDSPTRFRNTLREKRPMKKQIWMYLVVLVIIAAIGAACIIAAQILPAPVAYSAGSGAVHPPDTQTNPPPLLFLGNENLAPIVYRDGITPSGIDVDIVHALARHMPQPVEIRAMNWTEAQALVAQGDADVLIQINPTEERRKIYDFSDPLLESHFSLFIRTDRRT